MVESSTLLKCRRGNPTEGSNPSLSATLSGRKEVKIASVTRYAKVRPNPHFCPPLGLWKIRFGLAINARSRLSSQLSISLRYQVSVEIIYG